MVCTHPKRKEIRTGYQQMEQCN